MKRLANNFICAAAMMVAAAVAFSACNPQEEKVTPKVEVSESEITSEAAGETYELTVTSNVAWTAQIENKASWVTVKPASGDAGETAVKVTVKKNNSDQPRETSVSFVGESSTATVAVKQFGKDVVTLDKNAYEATPAGGSDAVKVTANTDWTATSSADWVTVAPATGAAGEATATVTVAANATAQAREAKVTFNAGDAKAEYTISQEGLNVTLSKSSVSDAGEGKTETVNVTANASWTAVSSADWVTVAPATGAAGVTEVAVTVAENSSEEARNATVTFSINENVTAVLNVTQAVVVQAGKVTIAVTNATATTATVKYTPDPLEGFTYYWDILPKDVVDEMLPSDEEKLAYVIQYINEQLSGSDFTWADVVSEGVEEYTYDGLEALTDYYAIAFGVDAQGNATTGLFKQEFKTQDVNPALKEWMGTWTVTSTDSYVSPREGTSGLTGKSIQRVITISTDSVFGLELGEDDLVVAGLSYTDDLPLYSYTDTGEPIPMETIGTVSADGKLALKNQCEVMPYGDYGMITWIGNSYIQGAFYPVTGPYAPFTLKLGDDKTTATGTPYSGKLSDNSAFVTNYYDIKLVSGQSASSFYTDGTTGALAGTWTLTKVQEAPAAAPQSVDMKSFKARFEKEIKVKENNLMKNLNSSYLYKAAQIR